MGRIRLLRGRLVPLLVHRYQKTRRLGYSGGHGHIRRRCRTDIRERDDRLVDRSFSKKTQIVVRIVFPAFNCITQTESIGDNCFSSLSLYYFQGGLEDGGSFQNSECSDRRRTGRQVPVHGWTASNEFQADNTIHPRAVGRFPALMMQLCDYAFFFKMIRSKFCLPTC